MPLITNEMSGKQAREAVRKFLAATSCVVLSTPVEDERDKGERDALDKLLKLVANEICGPRRPKKAKE